jgi:hypothetical protein
MLPAIAGGANLNISSSPAAWTDYGLLSYKVAAAVNGKDANNPHKRWMAPEQQRALQCMKALRAGQPLNMFKQSPFVNGRDSHLRCQTLTIEMMSILMMTTTITTTSTLTTAS